MDSALGIFARLLGGCFSAMIAPGVQDTHCFTSIYDGAHVRDVHVVTKEDAPVYQGETIYSEAPGGLQFVYVNSTGGVGAGRARVEGDMMAYDLTMRAAPGQPDKTYRGQWRIREDGYDAQPEGEAPIHFTPAD